VIIYIIEVTIKYCLLTLVCLVFKEQFYYSAAQKRLS
jgi:hypothetical protein